MSVNSHDALWAEGLLRRSAEGSPSHRNLGSDQTFTVFSSHTSTYSKWLGANWNMRLVTTSTSEKVKSSKKESTSLKFALPHTCCSSQLEWCLRWGLLAVHQGSTLHIRSSIQQQLSTRGHSRLFVCVSVQKAQFRTGKNYSYGAQFIRTAGSPAGTELTLYLSNTQVTVKHSKRQGHPAPAGRVNRWMSDRAAWDLSTHTHTSVSITVTGVCVRASQRLFSPEGPGGLQPLWASSPALRLLLQRRTSEESFPAATSTCSGII